MRISNKQWIRARMEKNRPWTAYALADLQPGYSKKAEWFCDSDGMGLTLLHRGFHRPLIFFLEHSSRRDFIVLNVREDNEPAIRVYDRLGYKAFCRYFELTAAINRATTTLPQ